LDFSVVTLLRGPQKPVTINLIFLLHNRTGHGLFLMWTAVISITAFFLRAGPWALSAARSDVSFLIFAEQMFIMGVWSQIAEYLYLKKKDPERPTSKWIGYMHGINRISLL